MNTSKQTKRVTFWIEPEQEEYIRILTFAKGLNKSEYIRHLIDTDMQIEENNKVYELYKGIED